MIIRLKSCTYNDFSYLVRRDFRNVVQRFERIGLQVEPRRDGGGIGEDHRNAMVQPAKHGIRLTGGGGETIKIEMKKMFQPRTETCHTFTVSVLSN